MTTSLNSLAQISLDSLRKETGALLRAIAGGDSRREPASYRREVEAVLLPMRVTPPRNEVIEDRWR